MAFTNEILAGSIPEIFDNIMRNFGMGFECCIPAVVTSYDRAKNLVTCQPAINRIATDGESVPRMEIEVPCWNPCGNKLGINFPLKPGETGHVIACDRDSTFFKQYLKPMNPQTGDIHKYCHGFFLPDKVHDFVIKPEDENALVIESLSGDTRISILETPSGASRVKLTRKTVSLEVNGFDIELKTPTSQITIADDGTINAKATNITIDGTCAVTTGASGVITMASVATVTNGIVTAIY